ncbi:MAG: hypothetical protein R2779_12655 [Crocinitomicaceae bacterium]
MPGGGTISTSGAKTVLDGSCSSSFYITGGTFENNSPFSLTVDYATITDNTVTGTNIPGISTNSILSGTTTGWSGIAAQARKLHWVNSSAIAGNSGDFYDGNNWEQLLPFYAPAPQCPPVLLILLYLTILHSLQRIKKLIYLARRMLHLCIGKIFQVG